jgi:hypothetical protein
MGCNVFTTTLCPATFSRNTRIHTTADLADLATKVYTRALLGQD